MTGPVSCRDLGKVCRGFGLEMPDGQMGKLDGSFLSCTPQLRSG